MNKREAIIKDLITCLEGVRVSAGYSTDFGQRVEEYNPKVLEDDHFPRCLVKDSDTDFGNEFCGADDPTMTVQILMFCAEKNESLKYARNMITDVYKCIGKNIEAFYTKYGDIEFKPAGDQLDVQKDDKTIGGAMVTITIKYTTHQWLIGEPEY